MYIIVVSFILYSQSIIRILSYINYMQNQDFDFYVPQEKSFGNTIDQYNPNQQAIHVVVSGFPYDEGTRINGGRIGGSAASYMFRKGLQQQQLYRKSDIVIMDSGDIEKDEDLQIAHEKLYKKNFEILKNPNSILFVIGGSNDQSYPNAKSLLRRYPQSKIAVINIDAHFDVRPLKQGKAHSGSPFRLLLEDQIFIKNNSTFVEFACKGASCSNQHYKYLKSKGCQVYWLQKDIRRHKIQQNNNYYTQAGQLFKKLLDQLSQKVQYIFVSFDIDSVSAFYMPGVSAPSVVGGLTDIEANEIMDISGRNKKVKLMDCSEFNPAVEYYRSRKFLAEIFYTFCMAINKRN